MLVTAGSAPGIFIRRLYTHPAISHEDAAGREAALVGGQEKRHLRYFFGAAVAAQRYDIVEKLGAVPPYNFGETVFYLGLKRVIDRSRR